MKNIFILIAIVSAFYGCATNQFKDNYNDEGLTILKNHPKQVQVIETTNLQDRVLKYARKGYVVVGSSHFEGEWEGRLKAKKWAETIGATLVIVSSQQTGTQEHQYTLAVPQINTTYHQGTINTTGYNTAYSGTSTSVSTSFVPGSYKTTIFEQLAIFMIPREYVEKMSMYSPEANIEGRENEGDDNI